MMAPTSTDSKRLGSYVVRGCNRAERHHLETARCGVARGRRLLLIIDGVVQTATSVRHAVLLHHLNSECLSANEGDDVDDDV
jgi:hypothetical protein